MIWAKERFRKWFTIKVDRTLIWMALNHQSGWWGIRKPACGSGGSLGSWLYCWRIGAHLGDGRPLTLVQAIWRRMLTRQHIPYDCRPSRKGR